MRFFLLLKIVETDFLIIVSLQLVFVGKVLCSVGVMVSMMSFSRMCWEKVCGTKVESDAIGVSLTNKRT